MGDHMTPYQASKVVNRNAGWVYFLVKTGKVVAVGEDAKGTVLVDVDAVKAEAAKPTRERAPKGSGGRKAIADRASGGATGSGKGRGKKPGVRTGAIVSYAKQGAKWNGRDRGQRVAQVEMFDNTEDAMTYLRTLDAPKDEPADGWSTETFLQRVKSGAVRVENPLQLLEMIAMEFATEGKAELRQAVDECLAFCKERYEFDDPNPVVTTSVADDADVAQEVATV